MLRKTVVVAGVAALISVNVSASAQSAGDKAAAEALFDKGKKLLKEKNYSEACPTLEESQKLDPGVGTLLYLAECYEQSGKTASAWATFREAAGLAKIASDTKREKIARTRADRLESKLSKLVLSVPAAAQVEGLVVLRDGAEVIGALWGTAIPVDPGKHVIEARAPGKLDYKAEVDVPAGAENTTFAIPALEDKPEPTKPPVTELPEETPEPTPAPPPVTSEEPDSGSGQRTLGIVVGVVGLLGLGAGTVFGLQAKSKDSDADANCRPGDPGRCNQTGVDLGREAEDAATLSTIAFGVGTLALAGGIILYATAPSDSSGAEGSQARKAQRRKLVRLAPLLAPGHAGMFVGGNF